MVACTVSLTVGYPLTKITALTLATTVSDTFEVARNWNSTPKLKDSDYNKESFETGAVDLAFLDGKTLKMEKKADLHEKIELTTYATDNFKNVNDITESHGLKLGEHSWSDLNLGQVNEKDVTRQNLVPLRINEKYVTALNLDTAARHAIDLISLQSIKSEKPVDFSNGPDADSRHVTAVNLESVQSERLNIEQIETEESSGQTDVAFGVDLEVLTTSAIFPDDNSPDEDGSFETLTSSGQNDLKQSDKEVEHDAMDRYRGTEGINDTDLEINQTQREVNQSEPKVNQTEPEVNYTEPEVENFAVNDTESMFSVETTPGLEIDKWRSSQEQSRSASMPTGSEDSSAVSTFKFPVSNESIYESLKSLVSALEQLGVLDSVGQCYNVERITKSQVGSSTLLKIELFLETRTQTSTSTRHEHLDNSDLLGAGNETDLTSGGYSGEEEDCSVNGTRIAGRKVAGKKCIPLMETDPGNWTDGIPNGTDWASINGTNLSQNSASKSKMENHPDNGTFSIGAK